MNILTPFVQQCREHPGHVIFLILCVLAVIPAVIGLDHVSLWYDEAQTAFIAKGILANGLPVPHDGTHFIPDPYPYYNEDLMWVEHPWLQFYITALSFHLFGATPVTARLPFLLISLCSLPLLYATARRLGGTNVARVTVLLLLSIVPYLLHIRQCRYYAILCFCVVWGIYACLDLQEGKKTGFLHFTGAMVGLFYSNPAPFAGFMFAFSIWYLAFGRSCIKWKPLAFTYGAVFLMTFPWFIYADLANRRATHAEWNIANPFKYFGHYLVDLNTFILPFAWIPIVLLFVLWRKGRKMESLLFLMIPITIVWFRIFVAMPNHPMTMLGITGGILGITTAFWVYRMWQRASLPSSAGKMLLVLAFGSLVGMSIASPLDSFRYIIGFIPLWAIIAAMFLTTLWRRARIPVTFVVVMMIGSNLLHAAPFVIAHAMPFSFQDLEKVMRATIPPGVLSRLVGRSSEQIQARLGSYLTKADKNLADAARIKNPYYDYLCEVTLPYRGPTEEVIRYLEQYALPRESIATDNTALMLDFYIDLKLEPLSIKSDTLTADWIYIKPHQTFATMPTYWMRRFYDEILTPHYEKIELEAPDLQNVDYNLPDPHLHVFRPDLEQAPRAVIFKRKNDK